MGISRQQRREAERRAARAQNRPDPAPAGAAARNQQPPPTQTGTQPHSGSQYRQSAQYRQGAQDRLRAHERRSSRTTGPTASELAEQLVNLALAATMRSDERTSALQRDALEALALTNTAEATAVLRTRLVSTLAALWTHGWQPLDVAHVVGRRTSGAHRNLLVAAMSAEHANAMGSTHSAEMDPRWEAQLHRLGLGDGRPAPASEVFAGSASRDLAKLTAEVGFALDILAATMLLPRLERLMTPPGVPSGPRLAGSAARTFEPRRPPIGLDAKVLARVRALLAKAESTTFDEEAEALTAKAQELMARHAIDLAMVDAASPNHGGPVARRVHLDDPYVDPKSSLLAVVASENRCRAVFTPSFGFSTVFGFEADLDIVELLFTSLLTQATTSMIAADKKVDRFGRSRTRSFRQSFLLAYAHRIGERLREANQAATAQATEDLGTDFLPVLASRAEQVESLVKEVFPSLKSKSRTVSNREGWEAGRAAADKASIRPPGSLPRGKS